MSSQDELFYVLECTADNCIAEFFVNDFPIAVRGKSFGHFHGAPANEYIINGVNEITMVLYPGDRPAKSLAGIETERKRVVPLDDAKASVRVCTYPKGAIVGGPDAKELLLMEWKAEPDKPVTVPCVRSATVDIIHPLGPWVWEGLPSLAWNDETESDVRSVLEELHMAFSGAMLEPFIEKCRHRFIEIDQAHYFPEGSRAERASELLPEKLEDPEWAMEPIESKKPDFRLCAKGRLVQAISEDWQACLRSVPDEGGLQIFFSMILGLIEDKWQIIR